MWALFWGILVLYGIGAVLGGLAVAVVATLPIRVRGYNPRVSLALSVFGIAASILLPALGVILSGQAPSPFWSLVYLLFLPSSILEGAQLALFGLSIDARRTTPRPLAYSGVALVTAAGLPWLAWSLFSSRPELLLIGVSLGALTFAFNLALRASAGQAGSPARREGPDKR